MPHQERYCLSSAFPACPIFLDWARQEAAGVVGKSGVVSTVAQAPAHVVVRSTTDDGDLLSRGRTTAAESIPRTSRASDPGSGLWGFEGAPRRTVAPASAPQRVSTGSGTPAYSMARRAPTRPDWENPPRLESFPRLRARDDRNNNQPLMMLVLAITVLMVGLVVVPLMSGNGGGKADATATAQGSPTDEPTPTASPTPTLLFKIYTVKAGDNLTRIANLYNVTPEMIIAANKNTQYEIKNGNILYAGERMFIPPPTWVMPTDTPASAPTPTPPPAGTPTPAASAS